MLKYVYKDKGGLAREFYVTVLHKESKGVNQNYAFNELVYQLTAVLTHKIGLLEAFFLDDNEYSTELLPLCEEILAIDGQEFGRIFANSVVMPHLVYVLNLHNYIKLPQATQVRFSYSFMVMRQEIGVFIGEYLYGCYEPSEKLPYMLVRVAYGDIEFTIYLDSMAVKYLASELFDFTKENIVESFDTYGDSLADILISVANCYFNLNLNLLSVKLGCLKKQNSYLPVLLQHNKYFGFTMLIDGWQKIDWSTLSLINQVVVEDDDTRLNSDTELAKMSMPLSIGYSRISVAEFKMLQTGVVLLLDECSAPNAVAVNCTNSKLIFSIKENKLVLSEIIS